MATTPSPSTLASIYGQLISWRQRVMARIDPTWVVDVDVKEGGVHTVDGVSIRRENQLRLVVYLP